MFPSLVELSISEWLLAVTSRLASGDRLLYRVRAQPKVQRGVEDHLEVVDAGPSRAAVDVEVEKADADGAAFGRCVLQ